MHLLRLTPFFHHPDVKTWPAHYDALGGMQIQIWRQAMWLAQQGIRQHVMTIGFPGLPKNRKLHANLSVERTYFPLPEWRSELTGLKGLTQSWALAILLRVRRKARQTPFDLVHIHLDGQIPALLVACLVPKLLSCPMILTLHCSRLAIYRPMSRLDRLMHRFARYLETKAVHAADTAITLTEQTAAKIRPYARRVEILPDVVDTRHFQHPAAAAVQVFRTRYGLTHRTLGFIGRIAHEKGWSHFVIMADRLRHLGLQFLVVGDGPQRHRLEADVAHYGLQAQFVITGFIPNDQVATAIAACRVIVMPSEHEEFGGVSIEAAAVGTPVAAYAVGGIKEILGKISPQLLAPPGDIDQLVDRVCRALTPSSAEEKQSGRSSPAALFSPEVVLPRLQSLYQEFTHRPIVKPSK